VRVSEFRFKGRADFALTRFYCKADFQEAAFEQGGTFRGAAFHEEAAFPLAKFMEKGPNAQNIVFSNADFFKKADFENTEWRLPAWFAKTTFRAEVSFSHADLGSVSLRDTTFSAIASFSFANVTRSLNLSEACFGGNAILNLRGLTYKQSGALLGALVLDLSQLKVARGRGRILGETSKEPHELEAACAQYALLAGNYREQTSVMASEARDWCEYRFMDIRREARYAQRSKGNMWQKLVKSPAWGFDLFLLKLLLGYGVYVKRTLLTGLGIIFLFAGIYLAAPDGLPVRQTRCGNLIADCGDALYFSAVTFTTVGYGDWRPEGAARFVAAAEALLGLLIMALFAVFLGRKIAR